MKDDQPGSSRTHPAEREQAAPDRATLLAFGTFVLIGSGIAIAIRFTFTELAPYWAGVLRFGSVALIFWILVLIRRVPLPRGRGLLGAALFGFLSVGLAFFFVNFALQKTQASLYQTIVAVVPLLTLLLARLHGLEKLRLRSVIGALVAVAGIAVALSGTLTAGVEVSLPHIVAILVAAACFGEASVIAKLFPKNHPLGTNAVAMTVGTIFMLTVSVLLGEPKDLPVSAGVWLTLAYLIAATTILFLLYLFILGRWTASGTSYSMVLMPIGTVILAALLVGETISLVFILGAALVLAGVWFGAIQPHPEPEQRPDEEIQVRPGLPNCS
ncbi:MAG: EamA family transporter [Anaerolineales bacterium]|nr:EamA family transporter [Anaerolineales bacterium]